MGKCCALNTGQLPKPSPCFRSSSQHQQCKDASAAAHARFNPSFGVPPPESDLLPVWSDRQGPQDRPCLCHFSQTRTWKNCYSFCTFCKSHFYLHFVAFIVSLALPPCFSRTPGNCWECQTSHLLWPTPHAFFTAEMAPACCMAFVFYPTPGMD